MDLALTKAQVWKKHVLGKLYRPDYAGRNQRKRNFQSKNFQYHNVPCINVLSSVQIQMMRITRNSSARSYVLKDAEGIIHHDKYAITRKCEIPEAIMNFD